MVLWHETEQSGWFEKNTAGISARLCEYMRRPAYDSAVNALVSKKVSRETDFHPSSTIKTYEITGYCRLRFCGRRVSSHCAGTGWWRAGSAEIPNGRTSATRINRRDDCGARNSIENRLFYGNFVSPLPSPHTHTTNRTAYARVAAYFLNFFFIPSAV